MLCSVMAIMKSYPALGDTALPLSLLALWTHIFPCKPLCYKLILFVSKHRELISNYYREDNFFLVQWAGTR